MLWPKHPKGIQRAISLQSLVSQYVNSVGRNTSRNGLTCQMKVIIESPEKSSHDVWWILKILCSQTKALLRTSPKIDEFYKQFYIFYTLQSCKWLVVARKHITSNFDENRLVFQIPRFVVSYHSWKGVVFLVITDFVVPLEYLDKIACKNLGGFRWCHGASRSKMIAFSLGIWRLRGLILSSKQKPVIRTQDESIPV